MKIFGFHDDNACGLYRILMPFWALRYLGGHEIAIHVGWDPKAVEYPLAVGQRIGNYGALPYWRRLRAHSKLVYEIDDDVWHIDPMNASAYRAYSEEETRDATEHAIAVSDMATCTTEPLAEVLRQFNSNVRVLPNCIDAKMFEIERPRTERVTVGWAGGYSHMRDLLMVLPELHRFFRQEPQVDWHSIGSDYRPLLKMPTGRHTDWQAKIWDYYRSIDFDIALAPLAPMVFNASKSGIKAMEMAALGIPTIASDAEPYRPVIRHGETGFLVRQKHEWRKYLRLLVNDRELRERMGAAAREAARDWTIQNNWWRWEEAYQSVLGGRLDEGADDHDNLGNGGRLRASAERI